VLKGLESRRLRHAVATGALVAIAGFCDAYYAVYAALLVGLLVAAHLFVWRWRRQHAAARWLRSVDVLLAVTAGLIVVMLVTGGRTLEILGARIALRTLYTPMLVLTCLATIRVALTWRPSFARSGWVSWQRVGVFLAVAAAIAAVVYSPTLVAMGLRLSEGRFERPAIHWRSSPPGVDLLAYVMPNPGHPLYGGPFADWLRRERSDGYEEYTASLPLVALAVIGLAWWRWRAHLPRRWLALAVLFGALSFGPFIHVAGMNTYVPGPWALLRYVPVVELARSPARFAVLATLATAVVFAAAFATLRDRSRRRGLVAAAVVGLLAFELLAQPRPLAQVRIPAIYDIVKADLDHRVRILRLPTGIRDGTSSLGDFNAESQFLQTYHEKRLLGGYLSRVSRKRKRDLMSFPVFSALVRLSAGEALTAEQLARAREGAPRFLRRSRLRYIVMDAARTSHELKSFAIELFDLELIAVADGQELYQPVRR
jgi:hypothetical protein